MSIQAAGVVRDATANVTHFLQTISRACPHTLPQTFQTQRQITMPGFAYGLCKPLFLR